MPVLTPYPVPPEPLRWRVIGNRNPEGFLRSGVVATNFFENLLAKEKLLFSDFESILDLGCGCGRLIRWLPVRTNATLTGCDIDPEAIAWCAENLPGTFHATGEYPPLPVPDASFDLILAVSVFTHIDEEHQFRWLAELKRISKPGAYLILTYRHRWNIEQFTDEGIKAAIYSGLEAGNGIFHMPAPIWKGVFPDWYGGSYHTPEYIEHEWGRYFTLLRTVAPGKGPDKKPHVAGVTQIVTLCRND